MDCHNAMTNTHATECAFEELIARHLVEYGGYSPGVTRSGARN